MMQDLSSLELKVISCRHLKAFNFFQRLSVYAAVSIIKDDPKSSQQQQQHHLQRQKTPIDRDGGSHPEWNHLMNFDVRAIDLDQEDDEHLFLKFDLRCEGVVYGKKCIGEVRVPFKDLIDDFSGTVRFVSYQVRSSEGRPNGVLNFSYKIHGKTRTKTKTKIKNKEILISTTSDDDQNSTDVPATDKVDDRKVLYPSLDDDTPARHKGICYPSLDDIQVPSTGLISIPTPKFGGGGGVPELNANMTVGPPWLPPHTVAHEAFYHLYHNHLPLLQGLGPYKYMVETAGYGHNGYSHVDHGDAWKVGVAARGGDYATGLYIGGGR